MILYRHPVFAAMPPALDLVDEFDPTPPSRRRPHAAAGTLPDHVESAVWRANELGRQTTSVVSSGWEHLDHELPGGGWPCQSMTEVLTAQPSVVEWRLMSPALRHVVAAGGQVVVVAPPRHPYLPGLMHEGLSERQFVWLQADAPAERLWVTEQLIKSNACGALIAWLPQARQEQLRRLQVCAQSCEGLVFLCRPEAAQHEASAAPLRVHATFGLDWEVKLRVLKRRGPIKDELISLPSIPGGLASVITPRLSKPSRLFAKEVAADVVGSTVVPLRSRRHAPAH